MRKVLAFGSTLALGAPVAAFVSTTMGVLGGINFSWFAQTLYYLPL